MSISKQAAAYRLLAADELGVLKVIEVPAGPKWADATVVQTWGQANKDLGVTCIACSTSCLEPGTPGVVAVGRKGRRVDILDAASGESHVSLTAAAPDKPATGAAANKVHIAAVAFVPAADGRPLQLIAGSSDGTVSVCTGSSSSWAVSRSFQAGNSITCLAVSKCGCFLLLGGEGVQPSIWDLAATKVWQAKGGKPHRQTLLVDKPFTTAVAFLPSSSSSGSSKEAAAAAAAAGNEDADHAATAAATAATAAAMKLRFVAGSASSKLHVYDTTAGRRPQCEIVFGETRITAVAPEQGGLRVWAANGAGHMQVLDLKANKMLDALKGAGGSVRSLALHPGGEPLIASAGLDRFVRVHNFNTKSGACRVYLKQQLTGVCWLPVLLQPAEAAAAAAAAAVVNEADTAVDGEPTTVQKIHSKKSRKTRREGVAAAEEPFPGRKQKRDSAVNFHKYVV